METTKRFVDFEKYCKFCKYADLKEELDPCNECLDNPVNENSIRPIHYKEADE